MEKNAPWVSWDYSRVLSEQGERANWYNQVKGFPWKNGSNEDSGMTERLRESDKDGNGGWQELCRRSLRRNGGVINGGGAPELKFVPPAMTREKGRTMDSTCEEKVPMGSSWFQQFKVVQELSREVKKLQMNASVCGAKLPFPWWIYNLIFHTFVGVLAWSVLFLLMLH